MIELDATKRSKIEVARDAVSLFIQLIRPDTGNQVRLVSFSIAANNPIDFPLTSVDTSVKQNLVGLAPYSGGQVGKLTPN